VSTREYPRYHCLKQFVGLGFTLPQVLKIRWFFERRDLMRRAPRGPSCVSRPVYNPRQISIHTNRDLPWVIVEVRLH